MEEHQFRWTLRNRRAFRLPSLLADGDEVASLLRAAARDVRRRAAVERALSVLLDPVLAERTRVERVSDDTVLLRVADGAAAELLRRQAGRLCRALSQKVGGITRVQVRTGVMWGMDGREEGTVWS